jgi:hypothetical protein
LEEWMPDHPVPVARGIVLAAALLVSIAVAQTPDPHIVFSEPSAGQVFAPGDRMLVVLRINPPLHATDAIIYSGLGMLEGKDAEYNGSTFRWQFHIPVEYAGPLMLTPMVVAGEDPAHPGTALTIAGAPITVAVRPKGAPVKLDLSERNFFLRPHATVDKQCLHVRGEFGNGREGDLTSPATGTTYRSSAPAVAVVDGEGCVTIAGPGVATVTAENRGVKDFATFVVEDPRNPLPPEDVTAKLKISRSTIRRDPTAKAYDTYPLSVQTITIANTSPEPVAGPLYLTVRDLPKGVELWIKASNVPPHPPPSMTLYFRQNPAPGKSVPVRLALNDGLKLNPGESVTAELYFLYSAGEPGYRLSVVRSMDTRQIP